MLITEDGYMTGAISGGCLEGDALRRAMYAIHEQKIKLVTYDTTDEDESRPGFGLGCNGVIQVLFEPIREHDQYSSIALLRSLVETGKEAVLVTLFHLANRYGDHPGTCLMLKDNEVVSSLKNDQELEASVLSDAKNAIANKRTGFKNYLSETQNVNAFMQFIAPPVSLVVIGAGNDVMPLVKMADLLGWKTTVVDARPAYANPGRFVPACRIVVSKPEKMLGHIATDNQTAFVLMTHNYHYDLAVLRELLKGKLRYIGLLGPRKKLDRMLRELELKGVQLPEDQLRNVYGPSGLNIGAETPEEIALSILAEIKSVFAGADGRALREREVVIHPRTETVFEQVTLIDR
jgi:xanthine/CO dehydrogenase XdhC/CoxF family maturation factor